MENIEKKFKVVKNTFAECYLANEDGAITTNELHDGSTITYKKGDWICNDPNNKNDIWPIEQSIHSNYTVSELGESNDETNMTEEEVIERLENIAKMTGNLQNGLGNLIGLVVIKENVEALLKNINGDWSPERDIVLDENSPRIDIVNQSGKIGGFKGVIIGADQFEDLQEAAKIKDILKEHLVIWEASDGTVNISLNKSEGSCGYCGDSGIRVKTEKTITNKEQIYCLRKLLEKE